MEGTAVPGTVTMLFTDIEGSTERFPALRTGAPEPASVAGIEGRADALADRISAAVMSHVERSILRALDADAEQDGR